MSKEKTYLQKIEADYLRIEEENERLRAENKVCEEAIEGDQITKDRLVYRIEQLKLRLNDDGMLTLEEQVDHATEEMHKLDDKINDLHFDVEELEVENKRYREVLSYVRELDCVDWNTGELAEMARKALEANK